MPHLDELIARFDVTDEEFIADPYPVLNAIREATPIFWHAGHRQWVLTRFDAIEATLRDRRLGRIYTHRYDHADFDRPQPDPRWAAFDQHERWSLLSLEPPDHTRLRNLVAQAFNPTSMAALQPTIEALSDLHLDRCHQLGRFDLLADYAQPYSVAVICSLLGVPVADGPQLLDWSHAIVKMYELSGDDAIRRAADDAAGAFIDYTRDLISHKRRTPDQLLVSALANVEHDGQRLTDDEIVSTTMVLVEAGHEATVNTLGNGVRALLHHRDQWRRLVDGDVEAEVAVEELLRWDAPLQLFERWVLEDGFEVEGQAIPVGQEVALLFGSAQRDPRRFDDPDTFDIGRRARRHIGFGRGVHYCIGAALARQELAQSIRSLAARFPDLDLAAEPTYHPTFVIRGLRDLQLTVG